MGVLADTHDLLRSEALEALGGSDLILHAGDVCGPAILESLHQLAPVVAVRGNNDRGAWADALPEAETVQLGSVRIHLLHALEDLRIDPVSSGIQAVVSGHSHQPSVELRDGVLFLNPGSAGPRRFRLPISLARLDIAGTTLTPHLIQLPTPPAKPGRKSTR